MQGGGLIDLIYPVGSIYISTNPTNPAELFQQGEWKLFGNGKTLVCIDSSQEDFNTVEKTGGESRHILTANEMPAHQGHLYSNNNGGYSGSFNGYLNTDKGTPYGTAGRGWDIYGGNELQPHGHTRGEGHSHNNLQPYIVVYMWKRIS